MKSMWKKNLVKSLWGSLLFTLAIAVTSCQSQENTATPPTPSPVASPITASSPSPVASPSETSVIDDLENNKGVNKLGGGWYTYDDKTSGGDSKVLPFKPSSGGANNSKFSALLKGEVTTKYKYGYIGIGMNLTPEGKAVDITQYKGVEFCAKGDNRKYSMKLRSLAIPDYNDYTFSFMATPEWKCHQVLFTDMKQLNPAKLVNLQQALAQVSGIQWQTTDQPRQSVELAVDDIRFWK